jgi:hypothetical protein
LILTLSYYGQKVNDEICVGSQETDEFIDKDVVEAEVYQTPKRRRIDTTEVFTETDDVVDYRPTQDELMAVSLVSQPLLRLTVYATNRVLVQLILEFADALVFLL